MARRIWTSGVEREVAEMQVKFISCCFAPEPARKGVETLLIEKEEGEDNVSLRQRRQVLDDREAEGREKLADTCQQVDGRNGSEQKRNGTVSQKKEERRRRCKQLQNFFLIWKRIVINSCRSLVCERQGQDREGEEQQSGKALRWRRFRKVWNSGSLRSAKRWRRR